MNDLVRSNTIEARGQSGRFDNVPVCLIQIERFGLGVVGFDAETHYDKAGLVWHEENLSQCLAAWLGARRATCAPVGSPRLGADIMRALPTMPWPPAGRPCRSPRGTIRRLAR